MFLGVEGRRDPIQGSALLGITVRAEPCFDIAKVILFLIK